MPKRKANNQLSEASPIRNSARYCERNHKEKGTKEAHLQLPFLTRVEKRRGKPLAWLPSTSINNGQSAFPLYLVKTCPICYPSHHTPQRHPCRAVHSCHSLGRREGSHLSGRRAVPSEPMASSPDLQEQFAYDCVCKFNAQVKGLDLVWKSTRREARNEQSRHGNACRKISTILT